MTASQLEKSYYRKGNNFGVQVEGIRDQGKWFTWLLGGNKERGGVAVAYGCNYLDNTGSQLLQSMRVSMLNGTIQMCVDSRFNKYEVPVFCINDPISYA